MTYDFSMVFDDPQDAAEQTAFRKDTKDILTSCVFVCNDTIQVYTRDGVKDVNVIATDDPNISQLISLHRNGQQLTYPSDGSVAISDKLAKIDGRFGRGQASALRWTTRGRLTCR